MNNRPIPNSDLSSTGCVARFDLGCERYSVVQHIAWHAATYVILAMLPLDRLLQTGLLASCLIGLCVGLPATLRPLLVEIALYRDGRFITRTRDGLIEPGGLDSSRCYELLTLTLVGRYDDGRKLVLRLYPGACQKIMLRRLRAWLKWQHTSTFETR